MPPFTLEDRTFDTLWDAALRAGARALSDRGRHGDVGRKGDGSPFTATDHAMEAIVVETIKSVSDFAIVAEEAAELGKTPSLHGDEPFWLVDALDGTREFIRGGNDFTVNIALIENRQPIFGIVHAPATQTTWHAIRGGGVFRNKSEEIRIRDIPAEGITLLGGKKSSEPQVLEPLIGKYTIHAREQRSSSLKFCLLAQGSADLYTRLGETYEWDTAAGDIIVREAGGIVMDMATHQPIVYGKADQSFINQGFIAGRKDLFRTA